MRKPILILLIVACLSGWSQHTLTTTWNTYKDLVPAEQDQGLAAYDFGDKVVGIGACYLNYNTWGFLSSVWDTSGNFISKKTFVDTSYWYQYLNKTLRVKQHAVYGVGHAFKRMDPNNDFDLYIVKFDASGDTVFTRRFADTGSVMAYDIVQVRPNRFAVLCQSAPNWQNVQVLRTYMVLIDSLGNIIKQVYGPAAAEQAYYLCHDPVNHELYALGMRRTQPPPATSYMNYSFARVFDDSTLNLVYSKLNYYAGRVINSAVYHKGSIYSTFWETVPLPGQSNPGTWLILLKTGLRSEGMVSKGNYIVMPVDASGYSFTTNLLADGERLMFMGYDGVTGSNMFFCDTTLHEICRANIPAPPGIPEIYYYSSSLTRSGKILHAGLVFDGSIQNGDSRVVSWFSSSINARQYVSQACGNVVGLDDEMQKAGFKLYPNPCDGFVSIHSEVFSVGRILIQLYDATGQMCVNDELSMEKDPQINTKGLVAGFYTVRITAGKQVWFGKIIKE